MVRVHYTRLVAQDEIDNCTDKVSDRPVLKRYEHQVISRTGIKDILSMSESWTEGIDGRFFQMSLARSFPLQQQTDHQTSESGHEQHAKLGPSVPLVIQVAKDLIGENVTEHGEQYPEPRRKHSTAAMNYIQGVILSFVRLDIRLRERVCEDAAAPDQPFFVGGRYASVAIEVNELCKSREATQKTDDLLVRRFQSQLKRLGKYLPQKLGTRKLLIPIS